VVGQGTKAEAARGTRREVEVETSGKKIERALYLRGVTLSALGRRF
jgi:hypothetical protein